MAGAELKLEGGGRQDDGSLKVPGLAARGPLGLDKPETPVPPVGSPLAKGAGGDRLVRPEESGPADMVLKFCKGGAPCLERWNAFILAWTSWGNWLLCELLEATDGWAGLRAAFTLPRGVEEVVMGVVPRVS